ncbi:dockerin type I domain-containing protein [Clostridium cellulovorans]|uniref:Lipolytic protein G-D-S-L family n=2 Tax=Clostridium cellulovorans TaxID=1493 RepID=D9SQS3_CLOC7|nr:dockerin type I domain-containing protein [Clostridium cellulovorans]ADL52279.1 lipolytic protein G-D-S-L family [Clostridium cellulovorans 743B]BAV13051.1 lipase and esterase [Clostridium cellulovorans]
MLKTKKLVGVAMTLVATLTLSLSSSLFSTLEVKAVDQVTSSETTVVEDTHSNMPLISRSVPAFSSTSGASNANDNNYGTTWYGTAPGWLAYDLSNVPVEQREKIVLSWYNSDTYDYDSSILNTSSYHKPKSYTIEGNSASGGNSAPASGWVVLQTVTNNNYHSREHVLDFSGYNWIRINITDSIPGSISINMDIHNAKQGTDDAWIILGDSITAGGTALNGNGKGTIAQIVNSYNPNHYPLVECGGTGSILSRHLVQNIKSYLSIFPGKYVGVAFGTNDSWGNQTGADNYYNNIEYAVKEILAAGKVPIVSKIPWARLNNVSDNVPAYNAKVEAIYSAYPQVIKGPDFWTIFKENQTLISGDNVHPSTEGYNRMREAWAETILNVYKNSTVVIKKGDVNNDGKVNAIDLAILKKHLLSGGLTGDALKASDMNNDSVVNAIDLALLKKILLSQA